MQRRKAAGGLRLGFLFPALRLFHAQQNHEGHDDRRQSAPEHGAPAIVRTHRVVEGRGQKEARVIASLQISSAHLAAIFRPGFSDVRARQRPFAANSDARQQAEQSQLRHRGGASEDCINEDGGGEHSGAAKPVGNRTPN